MAAHDGDVCSSTKRVTAGVTKVFQTQIIVRKNIALVSHCVALRKTVGSASSQPTE
jgi:hypothetical protein